VLRLHFWAFVLGNLALNATNAFAGSGWWAFWPLVLWGAVLAAHYFVDKSRRVSERWAAERAQDLRSKSYDRAHIDSIQARYDGPGKK
jgi:hypothetical protein